MLIVVFVEVLFIIILFMMVCMVLIFSGFLFINFFLNISNIERILFKILFVIVVRGVVLLNL